MAAGARQLQDRRRRWQLVGQGGAEDAIAGSQGKGRPANPGQRQIAQAEADAIAHDQRAGQNGRSHRHPEQRAQVAARVKTQIGP